MPQLIGLINPFFWTAPLSSPAGLRLRSERERLGYSQRAFATDARVSKNSQLAYEAGTSPITLDYLEQVEKLGVDVSYVVQGRRSSEGAGPKVPPPTPSADDVVEVAEIDLRYGMGSTFLDTHIEAETRSFSRGWLRSITESPPEVLFWARGQGDSMEHTIKDGEIVLIDRGQNTIRNGDLIWAFAFGDFGMIKRLRPMPDGSVKILSDNQSVPPEIAVDGELHIVGRVIAVIKRV